MGHNDSEQGHDQVMDHCYDGIEEYDNPLPGWWKAIFIVTIAFSALYGVWYHLGGPGVSEVEAYEAEMAAAFAEQAKRGDKLNVTAEMLTMLAGSESTMATTGKLFDARCAECHRKDGGGKIGPNLTDAYWIHGGDPMDIYAVVRDGVPSKGMLAWGKVLRPSEVANLAAYVMTLKGTNPKGPKKPEGKKAE